MIDLKNIKLVAWDLDDTFWSGTISEGEITPIAEHIQLVHDLTDCGIINTICSKNDHIVAEHKLRELGVWDEFVFASINWDNKAMRLQALIDGMALRPANVLFLDDNHFNLQEAQHVMPALQVAEPQDAIPDLIAQVASAEKKDLKHKRLAQYKVLEEKAQASLSYGSSEDFLYATHITVEMIECEGNVDEELLKRLHELVMRTNQLNFTKNRCAIEELKQRIEDKRYRCGYVKVHDKFGDYGIVGLYVLNTETKTLEHFLFSCRTMGQKIEQWVYAQLGFPKLTVVGEVRTQLNTTECPGWINQMRNNSIIDNHQQSHTAKNNTRILLKSPCDLSNAKIYIKNTSIFDTDFTYVSNSAGQVIDAYNHSVHILGLLDYSEEDKKMLANECIFIDPKMLSHDRFFTGEYDVIFLSSLIESIYGIYQRKDTNLRVVFGGCFHDITDPLNWDKYISGEYYNGGNVFTRAYLSEFSKKYEFIGRTTPKMYEEFLNRCLKTLPQNTTLCIILGATKYYTKNTEWTRMHEEINDVVMHMANSNPRLRYIAMDDIVHSESDFTDSLTHYTAKVYYEISQSMAKIIEDVTSAKIAMDGKGQYWLVQIAMLIRRLIKCVLPSNSPLYRSLKNIYIKKIRS